MRWVRRILVTLLLLALVAGMAGFWTTRRPLPTVDGPVEIAGLDGPVEVLGDVDGSGRPRSRPPRSSAPWGS
ncbi:MAG: hypothetical protein R6X29_02340 [Acidimicrobiia bacterium]